MLFHVYDEPKPEGYYTVEPVDMYRALLDADWPMYLLLPFLLIGIIILLMLAWRVHEIPTHMAHKKQMRQTQLVSALTLLGLFQHWVWALALFFAFMDWDQFEESIVRILRRAQAPLPPAEAAPADAAEVVAEAVVAPEPAQRVAIESAAADAPSSPGEKPA